ncbi:hypothetical protein [Paenibacillus sinopodophylli]|uniref:hypothetical protein n=1 Tax=Paenibacillus sinopodophylli TaxID=1837342 RepID=UPI00110C9775|nr:hypothetical protein [Paenibacillus sinopodophylli]
MKMKKWLVSLVAMLMIWMLPVMAYAADDNPITKIKKYFKFDWKILDGLGFMFYLIMIPISFMIIFLLIYSLYDIIRFGIRVKRAKASLNDKKFWIEAGVVFLIIFFFFSGLFLDFLEQVYTWTSNQDITSTTP